MKKNESTVRPGARFGSLTVVSYEETKKGTRFYLCTCSCGRNTVVPFGNLKSGRTKSCGNLKAHPKAETITVDRAERTRKWLQEVSGYSYGYICQLLAKGVPPEEISMGKGIRKRSVVQRKKRIIPLFEFRTIKQLATHLTITPARIYQRYKNGEKLVKRNGQIIFVKK